MAAGAARSVSIHVGSVGPHRVLSPGVTTAAATTTAGGAGGGGEAGGAVTTTGGGSTATTGATGGSGGDATGAALAERRYHCDRCFHGYILQWRLAAFRH